MSASVSTPSPLPSAAAAAEEAATATAATSTSSAPVSRASLLMTAPAATLLRFFTLALAAYHTLTLLAHLRSGRASSLRYRRVFHFWIVYGVFAFCAELLRLYLRLVFSGVVFGPRFFAYLYRLYAWAHAVTLCALVFPLHSGTFDAVSALLLSAVGGNGSGGGGHEGWSSAASPAHAPSGTPAQATGGGEARDGHARWRQRQQQHRLLRASGSPRAYGWFEGAEMVYEVYIGPKIESHEPEIELLLGRVRRKYREAVLALKQSAVYALAWVLANSGSAAEAASLGSTAMQGAQAGVVNWAGAIERQYGDGAAAGTSSVRDASAHQALRGPWRGRRPRRRQQGQSASMSTGSQAYDHVGAVAAGDTTAATAATFPASAAAASSGASRRHARDVYSGDECDNDNDNDDDYGGGNAVDAQERHLEQQPLQHAESWPTLAATVHEERGFPYRFQSVEEEAVADMYAAEEARMAADAAFAPAAVNGGADRAPHGGVAGNSLLSKLALVLTPGGGGVSLPAVASPSSPDSPVSAARETATRRRRPSDASTRSPASYGSMKFMEPGRMSDSFIAGADQSDAAGSASPPATVATAAAATMRPSTQTPSPPRSSPAPQARARAYDRVRELRKEWQKRA